MMQQFVEDFVVRVGVVVCDVGYVGCKDCWVVMWQWFLVFGVEFLEVFFWEGEFWMVFEVVVYCQKFCFGYLCVNCFELCVCDVVYCMVQVVGECLV